MGDDELCSQRGKKMEVYEGVNFTFSHFTQQGRCKVFRCYMKMECKAMLRVDTVSGVKTLVNWHSHDSEAESVELLKIAAAVKRRAAETMEPPAQIITHVMTGASQAAQNTAPAKRVYQQSIMRARTTENAQPKNPANLSFEIPEAYRQFTASNGHVEQFLLYDSGVNDPARMLVFGREQVADYLHLVNECYVDGMRAVSSKCD